MSATTPTGDGKLELISFEIAGQGFCIDTQSVREIRGWTSPTMMPNAPPYVLGVINLRGMVMPVLDLRARLGFGETSATSRHVYVVVQHGERVAGLLVDAVQETFSVDAEMLHPPPVMGHAEATSLVDAILTLEGRMLAHLVLGALLPETDGEEAANPVMAAVG